MPMVELVRIGSPGITALAITLNHPGVIDLTSFDSKMEEVTGGLYLIDRNHFPSCPVEISSIKLVVYRNSGLTLYGFPEPILCREFVIAAQGSVQGKLVSAGHIRVVRNEKEEWVERSITSQFPESLQEANLLFPKSSERVRGKELYPRLRNFFDFGIDGTNKGASRFRVSFPRILRNV